MAAQNFIPISIDEAIQRRFPPMLLEWNRLENKREMPWKGESDPYRIWLSEVLLQQTRVEQGLPYYERFVAAFPTVHHLANAPDTEVFKLWEGLGYYARCRNLLHTARYISRDCSGTFPPGYDGLRALKGIGPYTAAAIASFAFHLPYAVLDGNVFRILSRILDSDLPVDSNAGKQFFAATAQALLPPASSALYNQAIMDFGATVCKPVPLCATCFFQKHCKAFHHGRQAMLPVKEKKLQVRARWFHYFVIQCGHKVALQQRTAKDIWQHLFEPLLLEANRDLEKDVLLQYAQDVYGLTSGSYSARGSVVKKTQRLTHQLVHFQFIHLQTDKEIPISGVEWVPLDACSAYAFPKTILQFLQGISS